MTRTTTRDKRRDAVDRVASPKPDAPKFRAAESTCGKRLRTRCQKTTFGLCGHACLTTCVALESMQRDAMRLMASMHSASHLRIIRGRRSSYTVYSRLVIPPLMQLHVRLSDGRKINQLTVIDEYTRHGEMAIFCVMTSILVVRKKQLAI